MEISERMRRIKSKGTKPEAAVEVALARMGIPFRKQAMGLPGRPDFAIDRLRIAIFVHGCFWHCCPKHGKVPKSNQSYWLPKLRRNKDRHAIAEGSLKAMGWVPLVIWECECKEAVAIFKAIQSTTRIT